MCLVSDTLNSPHPFLRLSTSEPHPSVASADHTWFPQRIPYRPLITKTTPRIMSNFRDFDPEHSRSNAAPNGHGTGYAPSDFMAHEGSDFSFTAIAATPPPSFNPLWGPESSPNYAHGMTIDTSVEPVYPVHPQHAASNIYASPDWQTSASHVAGPSSYSIGNYSPDMISHPFTGLSIPPASPGSGGSPSPSSEFHSPYGGSPATPNFSYSTLPNDAPQQVFSFRYIDCDALLMVM